MDNEKQKLKREAVLNELSHRRTKLWNIFSWSSAIIIAITGGVIALKTGNPPAKLSFIHNIILSSAVVVLCSYAYIWINQSMDLEKEAQKMLEAIDKDLEIQITYFGRTSLGYQSALIILAVAAFAAIWLDLIWHA